MAVSSTGRPSRSRSRPRWLPRWACDAFGRRAYGFFLLTEDGSHRDNRVLALPDGRRQLDYDIARLPAAAAEHRRLTRTLRAQFLRLGYLPVVKPVGIDGTAHACGTLMAGTDPHRSVVDSRGRVHGLENLYVVDGSVLPRSSRVNQTLATSPADWRADCGSRLATRKAQA